MFDAYFEKYILIGDPKKQKKLLGYVENLRNHNSSGMLEECFGQPNPQPFKK